MNSDDSDSVSMSFVLYCPRKIGKWQQANETRVPGLVGMIHYESEEIAVGKPLSNGGEKRLDIAYVDP